MQRGIVFSTVILLRVITLGCRGNDDFPTPPAPPALTKRVVPTPPGRDDYAHRRFRSPLSLHDAEAILRLTQVFAFGDMPPKRQVQAFNVVFEQPDAVSRFQRLGETALPAGKLYALAGLRLLDRTAADRLRRTLADESRTIVVFDSDVVDKKPVRDLAEIVARRDMGRWFRRMRDETNAHYANSQ